MQIWVSHIIFDVYFIVIAFVNFHKRHFVEILFFPVFPFVSVFTFDTLQYTWKYIRLSKWLKLIFIAPIYIYHPNRKKKTVLWIGWMIVGCNYMVPQLIYIYTQIFLCCFLSDSVFFTVETHKKKSIFTLFDVRKNYVKTEWVINLVSPCIYSEMKEKQFVFVSKTFKYIFEFMLYVYEFVWK